MHDKNLSQPMKSDVPQLLFCLVNDSYGTLQTFGMNTRGSEKARFYGSFAHSISYVQQITHRFIMKMSGWEIKPPWPFTSALAFNMNIGKISTDNSSGTFFAKWNCYFRLHQVTRLQLIKQPDLDVSVRSCEYADEVV